MTKFLIAFFALGLATNAYAKIEVSAQISYAESVDQDATSLTDALKALGLKSYSDSSTDDSYSVTGTITQTNGADCDNGKETFAVKLNALDGTDKIVQTIDLDQKDGCTKQTGAEKFAKLLGKWGGSTLQSDCGLGHCWQALKTLRCHHFNADANYKAFDSCSVTMTSGI